VSGPRSQPAALAQIHAPTSQPGSFRAAVSRAATRLRGGEVHGPRTHAAAPAPVHPPASHAETAPHVSGPRAPAPLTVARSSRAVARAPRPMPGARPAAQPSNGRPAAELAAAAQAAGAEVRSGADFMEISFPPPPGAAPATVARTAAGPALPPAAAAPRTLGTPSALSRAVSGGGSGGGSGGSATDSVVDAVLKALREENEHLGVIDGIDPLF
jgi:hypothetical protein